MIKYPSIDNVWHTERKRYLEGAWTQPAFEYLKDLPWLFTEKIDGTSVQINFNGKHMAYFGRSADTDWFGTMAGLGDYLDTVMLDEELLTRLRSKFKVPVTLYGEGIGPDIQSGKYGPDYRFILFDAIVHTPSGDWWLERHNVLDLAASLGLEAAPLTFEGTLCEAIDFVRDKHHSSLAPVVAEGLVGTPLVELKLRGNGRVITKIKQEFFA